MRARRLRIIAAWTLACAGIAALAAAADLQTSTSLAYDAYVAHAKRLFLERVEQPDRALLTADAVAPAKPGQGDGISDVPGGLVHHWVSAAFIPNTTLMQALAISSAYGSYKEIYHPVIASTVVAQEGNRYDVRLRLKEGGAGVSAVLEVESSIEYFYPSPKTAYTISGATSIREVANAGKPDERLLPAGHDSGYLWRANAFTYFAEVNGGVYLETETIGLSRRFPALLGWIIEPVARRLGRASVERSLKEFSDAMKRRAIAS